MKRFYETVATEAADTGHVVTLDGRLVKTQARATLVLPTKALAEAVAEEWRAQDDKIVPANMPKTQLAYTALDRVAPRHDDVVREVAAFGGTDLLCYRADEPKDLMTRQKDVWNPYLDWARDILGAELQVTDGIMPIQQSDAALKTLMAEVAGHDAFELTVLHAFTNGLGSLVLALAYMKGYSPLQAVWQASILDSLHQEELWGLDQEVEEKRDAAYADLVAAGEFLSHLRTKTLESV